MVNRIIAHVVSWMPESLVWIFSRKYIAGKTLLSAIDTTQQLNNEGIMATIDVLGENITHETEAQGYRESYEEAIQLASRNNLDTTFSIKPTMFGLLLDTKLFERNVEALMEVAIKKGFMVRLDMEDSSCTDSTLDVFEKLYKKYPDNIGIVLQAYLKRTISDLKRLKEIEHKGKPVNVRLCKGIYIEPAEIAFRSKRAINENFIRCLEYMLENGFFSAIATHDERLILKSLELINSKAITRKDYEFQMLYGVRHELRTMLVKSGHPMRVYVPYGEHWFNYSTRRLKENPRMITHIVKALFVKG